MSGAVYVGDQDHWDFLNLVLGKYVQTNPLHADEYKMVCQMEAEVIRMIINIYNVDEHVCGTFTSGGTESNILGMLSYREFGRRRGISRPNMVMSNSAHASFDKGGFLMGIEIRKFARN